MLYDQGCYGQVTLGSLPDDVSARIEGLSGEWLEFDPPSRSIVVRHIQPSSRPSLPVIAAELVQMLSEIPGNLHATIEGGEFFVHTQDTGQFARLRVDAGGAVHLHWAHPDYARSRKRPWSGGAETPIEGYAQRLQGVVTLTADDAHGAAGQIQELADTFEGLYPVGDFRAEAQPSGDVRVTMRNVNLDVLPLLERLQGLAQPRTLSGHVEVSSFQDPEPERNVRFLFQNGEIWVQRPLLWQEPGGGHA